MSLWTSLSQIKRSYIAEAMDEAVKSPLVRRHGCIIVGGGKVISRGHNHYRKGRFSAKCSTHAEIDAINNIGDKTLLRDADLYVVRIGSDHDGNIIIRGSQPCRTCLPKLLKCMRKYGLRNVFYSVDP